MFTLEKVKALSLPDKPGCYIYKDIDGRIIYVGKAVKLSARVLSYWRESAAHSPAKHAMLKRIVSIEWIEVDSEIEALLLESNLIKKHQPEFNVLLRDDKRFQYIKISTEEEWPRIFATRTLDKAGRYFGPFTSASAVTETLKVLRRIWPFRSCRSMPKRACLYYRLAKCPGPCENKASARDYAKNIKQIIAFFEGGRPQVVAEIEKEKQVLEKKLSKKSFLEGGADELRFHELGARLNALKSVLEHTHILSLTDKYAADVLELAKVLSLPSVPKRIEGYDISNAFGREAVGSMVVFAEGEAVKGEYRKFKIKEGQGQADDVRMLTEVLTRRFKRDWPHPDLLVIDGGKPQLNAAAKFLKKNKLEIALVSISKGEGLRSAQAPDKIFFPGEKKALELPLASPALHLLKRVRDESHRFAIEYHRQLKRKAMFS